MKFGMCTHSEPPNGNGGLKCEFVEIKDGGQLLHKEFKLLKAP